MDVKEFVSSGLARGPMAAVMARESPISHVRVARATVAKVMVPKSIAVAREDTGAWAAAENFSSADIETEPTIGGFSMY